MKLIIDIDKDDYEYMKNGYVPHSFNMFYAIKNGTPIPDNATNEIETIIRRYTGEQADILYHLLTEQMTKAEIKAGSEK